MLFLSACFANNQAAEAPIQNTSTTSESAQESVSGDTFALYIGNSFTAGLGSSTGNTGIYELTKDMFQDSRCFISMGAGLLDYEEHASGINYVELLQDAIADESFDNSQVTHIFIIGARGECWARNELENDAIWLEGIDEALTEIDDLINNNFPNARYCGYAWADAVADYNRSSGQLKTYTTFTLNELIPRMLEKTCMQYMGWIGWDIFFDKEAFSSDGYHPNDLGYKTLAKNFRSAFFDEYECQPKSFEMQNFLADDSSAADESTGSIRLSSTPNGISVLFPTDVSIQRLCSTATKTILTGEQPVGTAQGIPVKINSFETGKSDSGELVVGSINLITFANDENEPKCFPLELSITCSDKGTSLYCKTRTIDEYSHMVPDSCYLENNSLNYLYAWPN